MLTEFGKFSRKLRIDKGELLKDMAKILDVTPSYLSAVEIGKRNVPYEWKNILAQSYALNEQEIKKLNKAIDDSQLNLKLDLNNFSMFEKDIALSFARNFKDLTDFDKESIKNILNKNS